MKLDTGLDRTLSEPLLQETDPEILETPLYRCYRETGPDIRHTRTKGRIWIAIHLSLILVYSTLFVVFIVPNFRIAHQLPLPAREALRPELRYFTTQLKDNPFVGQPRAELDQAWHDLLQHDNIHVPKKALDELHLNTVYFQDGSHGIASLSVFHSLHCLKLVRRMMYKEYYHSNLTGTALQRQIKHADHCVEYLRETLMCKPDISLVTFRWINDTAQHLDEPSAFYPTNFDSSQHECFNWDKINAWAGKRAFDLYDLHLLDRPHA